MKHRKQLRIVAGLILASSIARAGDVKIIANSSVQAASISTGELKSVFLEEKNSLGDGTHVEPVLQKDGPVHDAFLHEYLDKTDDDLRTYYRALVFTGRGSMPKEVSSDADVVAYVTRTRGAIGYIDVETEADGVRTLVVFRTGSSAERRLITRVEPQYPETLKRLNIGGIVRLQVTIAAKGNVEKVELLGGNPILGESAIFAVKQWTYTASHSHTVAVVVIPFDSRR